MKKIQIAMTVITIMENMVSLQAVSLVLFISLSDNSVYHVYINTVKEHPLDSKNIE